MRARGQLKGVEQHPTVAGGMNEVSLDAVVNAFAKLEVLHSIQEKCL